MPEVTHRMIETNGIRLHVAEQGEGPLVILCHGFPECWYSWRHQLPALAKAGFRAVAPDLRGYGQSDRPEEVEKYTILDDIGDIVGLVDALGAKQAVIAGHDIGAAIAWQTALLRPDRFRAVIALSPPFRSRGFGDSGPPTTLMPRTENAVFYQLFLQNSRGGGGARARPAPHVPFPALLALGRQAAVCRRRRVCCRDGSPERRSLDRSGVLAGLGHGVRHRCLCRGIHAERIPRPLAWWRNIDRGWELMAPFAGAAVTVPALYMAGERDFVAAVFSQSIAKQSALVPKLRPPIMLPGCGHWTQQERAPEVSTAMIDFLRSL